MEEVYHCKKCGKELEWADTIDHEGGIQEGYIIERQIWTCEDCDISYVIEQRADFQKQDVSTIYFEES